MGDAHDVDQVEEDVRPGVRPRSARVQTMSNAAPRNDTALEAAMKYCVRGLKEAREVLHPAPRDGTAKVGKLEQNG